jgi:hypothetical protein
MIITQRDKNIVNQGVKELFVTIELLNQDMKVVDVIEGNLISDSFSVDAESDVRRTYSMELLVTNSSLFIGEDKRIWMDKYIRPYVGIKEARTNEIVKYLKGTYTILDGNYSFDATTHQLSLSCSDLMSEINGERNGAIKDAIRFEEGADVRELIVDLLKETNVRKYILSDLDGVITPHEIEFEASQTYYDVIHELISLFSYYEMFFDLNGTFIIQKIPHQDSDSSILTHDFLSPLVISENTNVSFKEVYNKIELWGQSLEPDFSTDKCTYDASTKTYKATFEKVDKISNFKLYSILIPKTNGTESKLTIAGTTGFVTDDKGKPIPAQTFANTYNVFKYRQVNNDFYWLGEFQVYAESKETNTLSPFHESKIGEVKKVLTGDEYSKIYSNSLAQDRADYELYHACRLKESINVTMIDIPWLDVNWLIEYQSYTTKDTNRYVIKQINGSTTEGTIEVSMVLFYDQDPYS